MRRALPLGFLIGCSLAILVGYFVPIPGALAVGQLLVDWASIIAAMALVVGVVHLFWHHLQIIARGGDRWPYSLILLFSAGFVLANGVGPGSGGPNDPIVAWIFSYIYTPLSATFFALLAFYAVAGVYRILRLGVGAAGIMGAGSLVVLLGQIAPALFPHSPLPFVREWALAYPVAAGLRAVALGVSIGITVYGARIILGAEHRFLSE